jgi:GT2 family glycosyltransferase
MTILFVFTNYNNSGFTRDAIESIEKIHKNFFKIIVVDNASDNTDVEQLEKIERQYSNVKVIYSPENVGYFKGLNLGIKYSRENYLDINCMVVGNNDVLFHQNFHQSIVDKKDLLQKFPVVAPNIITADGFHQNPHVIHKISKVREFVYDVFHMNFFFTKLIITLSKITHSFTDRKDEEQHEIAQEIHQGYGAMYILMPKFFDLFEELWSPTFLMYEEYFLSKQLLDKGYKVFYEPSIKLTHLMHATTDKLPGKLKWRYSKRAHKEYRKYIKGIY